MTRRRFNRTERTALYVTAGGRCEGCGAPLGPGWHADHVQPWSRDGATDVVNAQALCPACNQSKGATVTCDPNDRIPALREWQQSALEKLSAAETTDFLLVATPAAGKTRAAAEEMRARLSARQVERVVVVVPSDRLKKQWKDAVHHYTGLGLETDWRSDAPDVDGLVVTYQQVALGGNAMRHRHDCRRPTMVVLDEVHHAGKQRQWGEALSHAFEHARFRLALSGTPFRHDGEPIPFITYVEGVAQADETYSYGQALRDKVCRPVFFPRYGGRAEWTWDGKLYGADFDDDLSEDDQARRLRTALVTGDFVPTVLRDADAQLSELRLEHPDAAGLVIAMDQEHARTLADQIQKILGHRAVLVVSDNPDAGDRIDAFARGTERWLVAVRMVSEGVDIPRLRVAVYATNIRSELFFRQAVGRIVRWQEHLDDNSAYFYIPDDPKLREHAELIKTERDHHLDALQERMTREVGADRPAASSYAPVDSSGTKTGTTFDGVAFSPEELAKAAALAGQAGLHRAEPAAAARLIRMVGGNADDVPSARRAPGVPPLSDRKKALRDANNTMAKRYAFLTERPYAHVNHEANQTVGIDSVKSATEEQLERRLAVLAEWLDGVSDIRFEVDD